MKEPRARSAAAMETMGNGDRNHDASADASVDGWFDLLDEELEREAPIRPATASRAPNIPVALAGLNEISNKITPVMLAPVHPLLPIEPSVVPDPPRDAWDDDLLDDPFGGSFFTEPAANGGRPSVASPPLPPLVETENEHGQEFFEFGEAPQGGAAPMAPASLRPAAGFAGDPFPPTPSDAQPPPREGPPRASVPPTGRLSHTRRSHPPAVPSIPSMSLPRPTAPPRTPTLLGQSLSPPPPSTPLAPPDEDSFDLSDFDRWGESAPLASTAPPTPFHPLERPTPSPASISTHALFTDGSEFVSPPESEGFSEALTAPRLGPSVPSVSPSRPTPDQATPTVHLRPPAASHSAPTRPGGAPSAGTSPRNNSTMTWDEAPTPAMGTPIPSQNVLAFESPQRPPPLPHTDATSPRTTVPPASGPRRSPSSPRVTPDIAPVRRISPRQEMHERLDVGDFTAALSTAETMLEVDPSDQDAMHVAEVCRAKLKAIYVNRLGSLDKIPLLAVHPSNLRSLALDHRSGFLLSMIDGMSSIEEILDIAAMPPLETLRTLYNLLNQHIITLRDR